MRIYEPDGTPYGDGLLVSGLSFPSDASLAVALGGAWGADLYAISDGDLLRFDAVPGSPSFGEYVEVGSGFDTMRATDITFWPDGDLYVAVRNDCILRVGSDCNGNGVPDTRDIADGTSLDNNGNGIPDECENQQPLIICNGPVVLWSPDHELVDVSSAFDVLDPNGDPVTLSFRGFSDEPETPLTATPDDPCESRRGGHGWGCAETWRKPLSGSQRGGIQAINRDERRIPAESALRNGGRGAGSGRMATVETANGKCRSNA
jgi:hypothetical protein